MKSCPLNEDISVIFKQTNYNGEDDHGALAVKPALQQLQTPRLPLLTDGSDGSPLDVQLCQWPQPHNYDLNFKIKILSNQRQRES
jgi:hypothetical protein